MERSLYKIPFWLIAIVCLIAGLYIALDHSHEILKIGNYLLGPLGNQAINTARVIYPIINGEQSWQLLFSHVADQRLVVPRLLVMYDFFMHNGIEQAYPYRILSVYWLTVGLLSIVLFNIKDLPAYIKCLLTGCALALIFSGISLVNYSDTILFTRPLLNLFALISFISASAYSDAAKTRHFLQAKLYLALTALFVVLSVCTLSIGLLLWPIIFLILHKQGALRFNFKLWCTIAILTYVLFFWHFAPSFSYFFHNPFTAIDYFSRLVSLPLITSASSASPAIIVLGIYVAVFSLFYLYQFWRKKKWSVSETIIFAYFLFAFIAVLFVAGAPDNNAAIDLGYTTFTTVLFFCLLTSVFIFNYSAQPTENPSLNFLLTASAALWLLAFFIPNNVGSYNLGATNQYFIALSMSAEADQSILAWTKKQDAQSIADVKYNTLIQKKYQKGAFSLWPAQHMNDVLAGFSNTKCMQPQTVLENTDNKIKPSIAFVQSIFAPEAKIEGAKTWFMVMTDSDKKIIGYGLPTPDNGTLSDKWRGRTFPQVWRGAANVTHTKNNQIQIYFVEPQQKLFCAGGMLKI